MLGRLKQLKVDYFVNDTLLHGLNVYGYPGTRQQNLLLYVFLVPIGAQRRSSASVLCSAVCNVYIYSYRSAIIASSTRRTGILKSRLR